MGNGTAEVGRAGAVRALPTPAPGGYDRVPPHNLDAETSILGAMLLSRDAIAEVAELVGPDDFYRGAHRTMYEAMRDLYDRGEPVDPVTLADELEHRGTLEDVGGAVGIADLVSQVPTAANALYYARIVAEQALRRRLIDAGTDITRLGYDAGKGADEAVDAAEQTIYDVAQRGYSSEFMSMKDLLMESFERIEKLHESKSAITGLATGFTDFDELTAGLQPQNLVVIAARPAMGKSTLITNIAAHVTVEERQPAVLFSLEMSQRELIDRVLAAESGVDSERLRTGRLKETDWPRLSQAMGRLAEAPLFIDDTPGINMMEIRGKCRRLKAKHGLALVIVDYLQLMQSHRRAENRVQEVSELSRGLKILAKELDVPVIALSQLSRKPEDRTDRRPQLSDLRESGCVTGDTLVSLASGDRVPIASLVGMQPDVVTLDGWHVSVRTASKVWRTGRKPVFRLTTMSGRVIAASGNHPLRVLDGWRALEKLTPGDRVAVPGRCPDPGAPTAWRATANTDADTVPVEVWTRVKHRMQALGISQRRMTELRGTAYGAAHFSSAPSREVLQQYAAILDDVELKEIACSDVYWDTVREIELLGTEDVYDMTVPGTHNFVGNGVCLHNSIEQDSDLVAFIYRDEVYNPDTDAKGEAELIVSKHRNGPLRTIRLSFIGHHSRFANMARRPMPPAGGGPL